MEMSQAKTRSEIEARKKKEIAEKKLDDERHFRQTRLKGDVHGILGPAGQAADSTIKAKAEASKL